MATIRTVTLPDLALSVSRFFSTLKTLETISSSVFLSYTGQKHGQNPESFESLENPSFRSKRGVIKKHLGFWRKRVAILEGPWHSFPAKITSQTICSAHFYALLQSFTLVVFLPHSVGENEGTRKAEVTANSQNTQPTPNSRKNSTYYHLLHFTAPGLLLYLANPQVLPSPVRERPRTWQLRSIESSPWHLQIYTDTV